MEKLANVAFILKCDGIEDSVKMAAVTNYITSIDSLGTDEEKTAALEEFESFLKEAAGLWSAIAPKLLNWGGRLGARGGMAGRLGNWLQRAGVSATTRAFPRVAGSVGKAATGAAGKSGLLNWMAAHPTSAKLGLGGAIAGGTLLGGGIYGGMKSNEAYKRGYGTAVGQLSPMVSALYAPQGAMTLPASMRRA